MLAGNKVIITIAINGGMQQARDGAIIPKQPREIGEAAARCYEAGAAMIHVHARDAQGKNSGDLAIYAEILREIRARSPILVQTTNGIGVRRDYGEARFAHVPDDIRLSALLAEDVRDIGKVRCSITPHRARAHFAVVHRWREGDARKRFVFSESARSELSRELSQPERSVQTCVRVDEQLRLC